MKRPSLADDLISRALAGGGKVLSNRLPEAPKVSPRRNKYNARPTVYNGVRYASKGEAAMAESLDLMVKSGVIDWWIGQPVFRLGCPENKYQPDFLVVAKGGVHAIEVKGVETAKFRRDKKLWAAYGPCNLHVVYRGREEIIHPGDPAGEER